jgi:hypothetical protein
MTLYTRGLGGALSSGLRAFLLAQSANIPTDVTFTFPTVGDQIEDSTGAISGSWTGGAVANLTGTGGGAYMLGTGYSVKWTTGGVVNSRHVKGRTAIVPAISSTFTSDGRMDPTQKSTIDTAAAALITATSSNLCVWSRPTAGRAGSSHLVLSGAAQDLPTWLTTRKR